ncbi:MAG: metalloregulator ArsR/SmtB family transcription factor [Oscillospiraceae bacterium]|nr:metalloregulator ArsR/SmtB family transcription factor [Oscillospiraceae bacterium]
MVRNNKHTDRCDCNVLHHDIVERVRARMLNKDDIQDISKLFKVLGDFTRVKIISALLHSEMCVCDIAALLNMTKSAISHQLRVLKQARLVKYRRDGKIVFYSLDDRHIKNIFNQAHSHIKE